MNLNSTEKYLKINGHFLKINGQKIFEMCFSRNKPDSQTNSGLYHSPNLEKLTKKKHKIFYEPEQMKLAKTEDDALFCYL
jgi:hypothetical protein